MSHAAPERRNGAEIHWSGAEPRGSSVHALPHANGTEGRSHLTGKSVLVVGDATDEQVQALTEQGVGRVALVDLTYRASRPFADPRASTSAARVIRESDLRNERFDVVLVSATEDEVAVSLAHAAEIVVQPDPRLSALNDRVAELLCERQVLNARLANLGQRLRGQEILVGRLDEATSAYERALSELAAAEQLAERRRQELSRTRADIVALTSTVSWRLTRPLRWVRRHVGRA